MKQSSERSMVKTVNALFQRGLVLMFVFLLCGCSARDLYKAGQDYQRQECRDVPESEYDSCMEQADKSYEAYERIKKGGKRAN